MQKRAHPCLLNLRNFRYIYLFIYIFIGLYIIIYTVLQAVLRARTVNVQRANVGPAG